ncbi:MAG TPA: hypothetical protein VD694_03770 [Nitrososphaeraceae archaeon]|nr:hypothetical protein [Nitrososphaeraceae archaeon]
MGLTIVIDVNRTFRGLIYGSAASTLIAGLLHLALVPMFLGQMTTEVTVFFLASGLAQIFWILPTVRKWIMPWYYIGIGGTIVLIVLWIIYIPGSGYPVDLMSAAIVSFQIAFVILSLIIIKKSKEESIKS